MAETNKVKRAIRAARRGNDKAWSFLVKKYQRLIWRIVHSKTTPGRKQFLDDAYSQGLIGLIKAVDTYDETKGIKFITYLYYCVRNEVTSELKRLSKHSKNEHLWLDSNFANNDFEPGDDSSRLDFIVDENVDVEQEVVEKIMDSEYWDVLMDVGRSLTGVERRIFLMKFIDGESAADIAAQLDRNKAWVYDVLNKIGERTRVVYEELERLQRA